MTNYTRGRKTEYDYCNFLKKNGWDYVVRTAGSHSNADVIAISKDEVLLVQLKRTKNKNFSYKKELQEFINWKVPISCTKRFVVYVDRIGFVKLYES